MGCFIFLMPLWEIHLRLSSMLIIAVNYRTCISIDALEVCKGGRHSLHKFLKFVTPQCRYNDKCKISLFHCLVNHPVSLSQKQLKQCHLGTSYSEIVILLFLPSRTANLLCAAADIKQGDLVMIILPAVPEYWMIQAACLRTGWVN